MGEILGDGEITKAITVTGCYISVPASEKIVKAGGSVTQIVEKVIKSNKPKAPKVAKEPKLESKLNNQKRMNPKPIKQNLPRQEARRKKQKVKRKKL